MATATALRGIPRPLRKHLGMRPAGVTDQLQRVYLMAFSSTTQLLAAAGTSFMEMARGGLLLCPETESFIYDGDYGHIRRPYRKGSRPLLERYIAEVTTGAMSAGEKVVALCQSLNDLPRRFGTPPAFLYGESDEETLLKGGGHCSCKARLLAALCQVIGLEARPVMFQVFVDPAQPDVMLGGHTVTEVLIDGQWGFFDPQLHLYCQTRSGHFPSVRDIRRQPELLTKMDPALVERVQPARYWDRTGFELLEHYRHRYFQPQCPTLFATHEVNRNYVIHWTWADQEFRRRQAHDFQQLKQALLDLAQRGGITDEIYQMDVQELRRTLGITDAQLHPPKPALASPLR